MHHNQQSSTRDCCGYTCAFLIFAEGALIFAVLPIGADASPDRPSGPLVRDRTVPSFFTVTLDTFLLVPLSLRSPQLSPFLYLAAPQHFFCIALYTLASYPSYAASLFVTSSIAYVLLILALFASLSLAFFISCNVSRSVTL